jgi:hypothetical protein
MKAVCQVGRVTPCAPVIADDHHAGAARRGLTRPTSTRSEFRAWRLSLPAGMERDTLLMPDAIAESVCAEVSRFLDVPLPARYAVWLEAKAHRCYSAHRHFYQLMQAGGNVARDRLYMFMRHWLASLLHLERPDLSHCLPVTFGDGKRLPPGNHPRINRVVSYSRWLPAPRDWQPSRVTRHHRWAWLTQIEAADVVECNHHDRHTNRPDFYSLTGNK